MFCMARREVDDEEPTSHRRQTHSPEMGLDASARHFSKPGKMRVTRGWRRRGSNAAKGLLRLTR